MSEIAQPYVLWRLLVVAVIIAGRWIAERWIPRGRRLDRHRR